MWFEAFWDWTLQFIQGIETLWNWLFTDIEIAGLNIAPIFLIVGGTLSVGLIRRII